MRGMSKTLSLSADLLNAMLETAAKGGTLDAICKAGGLDRAGLWRLVDSNNTFREKFTRARDKGYDELGESLLTIPDTYEDAAKARLKSENIRWLLARRAASRYGDRLEMNVNGTIDLNAALNEASMRLRRDSALTIEGETLDNSITYEASATDNQSAPEPEPDIFG